MKKTLKLVSPYTLFDLQSDLLTFTQIKLKKLKFRVFDYNKNVLLIYFKNISTPHKFYDGLNIVPYTFSIPSGDTTNTMIAFNSDEEIFVVENEMNLRYLEIVLFDQSGEYDLSCALTNPCVLELEFI